MENSSEIIEELKNADRYLDDTYKNSNYYKEYLQQVFIDLTNNLNIT